MTEAEVRQFHDALCGAGRVLSDLVWWFEDFLKGLKDGNSAAIEFSRYGECDEVISAGSLSWYMKESAVGATGKFRIRADLVLHDGSSADQGALPLPAIIWQIFATSTKQGQRLDLMRLPDYLFLGKKREVHEMPKLQYVDESHGRSSFFRRVFLITSPASLQKDPKSYLSYLQSMINAMQRDRFFRAHYEAQFAKL